MKEPIQGNRTKKLMQQVLIRREEYILEPNLKQACPLIFRCSFLQQNSTLVKSTIINIDQLLQNLEFQCMPSQQRKMVIYTQ